MLLSKKFILKFAFIGMGIFTSFVMGANLSLANGDSASQTQNTIKEALQKEYNHHNNMIQIGYLLFSGKGKRIKDENLDKMKDALIKISSMHSAFYNKLLDEKVLLINKNQESNSFQVKTSDSIETENKRLEAYMKLRRELSTEAYNQAISQYGQYYRKIGLENPKIYKKINEVAEAGKVPNASSFATTTLGSIMNQEIFILNMAKPFRESLDKQKASKEIERLKKKADQYRKFAADYMGKRDLLDKEYLPCEAFLVKEEEISVGKEMDAIISEKNMQRVSKKPVPQEELPSVVITQKDELKVCVPKKECRILKKWPEKIFKKFNFFQSSQNPSLLIPSTLEKAQCDYIDAAVNSETDNKVKEKKGLSKIANWLDNHHFFNAKTSCLF